MTTPLEQAINGVEGMAYMTLDEHQRRPQHIAITFDVTRDLDQAAVDVQNRISQVEGRLPNEVRQVGITVNKASSGFVFGGAFYSENGQYDPLFLSNYIDVFIKDALKRVPGVADVIIFGERKYSMRLWLDPDRLAGRGLTAADVVNALREQNVQVAAGQVGQPPAPTARPTKSACARSAASPRPSEFENIILQDRRRRHAGAPQGRRPRRARRRGLHLEPALQGPRRQRLRHHAAAHRQRARRLQPRRRRAAAAVGSAFRPG